MKELTEIARYLKAEEKARPLSASYIQTTGAEHRRQLEIMDLVL